MKKREITNNELEQMFNAVIELTPLLNEDQVNSLLTDLPKSNPGSAVKRFFQNQLNTLLLGATGVLIIIVALIWINSDYQSEDEIVQNYPQEKEITPVPVDTIEAESAITTDNEIIQKNTDESTGLKESPSKTSAVVTEAEKTISLPDIYKHFNKKPQRFSIKANRDTAIICKEGTSIKINANSFISEKTGNEISGIIQIAVKEYYKISDIILSNLTTTSGDKILETGGMLHISASAKNENCIIKPGSNIEIGFPYSNKRNDMALFYGQQTNNKINWKPAKNDDVVIVIQDKLIIADREAEPNSQTFLIVEDMPEFPGGEKALQKYLEQNVYYPFSALKDKTEGKVTVNFVIDSNGNTRNIRVLRGLDKTLDKVAVYVISNLPKWKPGKQRGKPVNVSYTMVVPFSAKEGELTLEEIRQSKELEEKLKDFKYDIEANNFYANNKEFEDFEKKVKNDNFQETNASEVNRYIFSVTQLGWINCDKFYKNNNPVINFYILTDNSETTIVNAIFRRFKSLIPGKVQPGKITFDNIPFGEKVTIVALKTVNNKIFLSVNETELTKNGELKLDFQQVTMELLKKEMEKLNKLY